MFGFGLSEFIVIVILLIILVKPEELPSVMRKIGEIYGQLRRISTQLIDEIESLAPEEKKSFKTPKDTVSYEKKEENHDRNI